ncbi:MAG: helix-turn-helix domain-containing protein [Bacteroidetes bacterium]|nr:helix-turn-helix domain-containing protein [Bacteroidota bacterium]
MARAYLGWSQQDLADRVGVVLNTINHFEKGERQADTKTVNGIAAVFTGAGLEFANGGVTPKRVSSYQLDSYLDLLDDISEALPQGGEVLKHCVDDRRSTPEVTKKVEEMHRTGIRERATIADDNDFVAGDPADYRQIPAGYFASSEVVIIFLNRVAFFVDGKALVIVSESLAKVFRDQFEYWWKEGKVLNGS